jgi:O-antigen/teichoic acid export membrane protein
LLCHLFAVVDRYMLVHWSGLDNAAALALVGHYHASRIVPLLFLCIADLLGGVVMPYLSHDWESGARQRVSERLNLILKFASVVMLAGGVTVLWLAPALFHFGFDGRYDEGLAVLPWTLTYCVWYGLLLVAQNYIWCAERMKLGTLPLAVGLAVNMGLNLVLIPVWGLLGAVMATTASTGLALAVLYWINHCAGMQLQMGMLWLSVAPLALCGGVWPATAAFLLLLAVLPFSRTLLSEEERDAIATLGQEYQIKLRAYISRRAEQAEVSHATW